jgi:hypothetical protein
LSDRDWAVSVIPQRPRFGTWNPAPPPIDESFEDVFRENYVAIKVTGNAAPALQMYGDQEARW